MVGIIICLLLCLYWNIFLGLNVQCTPVDTSGFNKLVSFRQWVTNDYLSTFYFLPVQDWICAII